MNKLLNCVFSTTLLFLTLVSACSHTPKSNYPDGVLPIAEDRVYTVIQLCLFQSDIDEYPEIIEGFKQALQEWAQHVPVVFDVFTERDTLQGLPAQYSNKVGMILVKVVDIQAYGYNPNIMGMFMRDKILLDAERLSEAPELIKAVSMHELGHLFGLPHVVSEEENAYTWFFQNVLRQREGSWYGNVSVQKA